MLYCIIGERPDRKQAAPPWCLLFLASQRGAVFLVFYVPRSLFGITGSALSHLVYAAVLYMPRSAIGGMSSAAGR